MSRSELDVLYEKHRARLLRTATRMLPDQSAAEDVVQETWLRALNTFGSPEATGKRPAPAWLYRVAVNLCYDHLRSLLSRRTTPRPAADLPPSPGPIDAATQLSQQVAWSSPEEAVLRLERAEAVQSAVNSLPQALREVVLLREYGDLKYREIAEIIGCPVGTVMSRLHLARARLKRELASLLELDVPPPAARRQAARSEQNKGVEENGS